METNQTTPRQRVPWNKGKLVGQKAPFKLKDIWALRVRLQMEGRVRELALFNLGIDSKLRGCDLVGLKVRDVCHGDQVATRAVVMQHKTQRPVQFEITQATRDALHAWMKQALELGAPLRQQLPCLGVKVRRNQRGGVDGQHLLPDPIMDRRALASRPDLGDADIVIQDHPRIQRSA